MWLRAAERHNGAAPQVREADIRLLQLLADRGICAAAYSSEANFWLDANGAASALGVSAGHVRWLAKRGRLEGAVRLGGMWVIPALSVEKYRRTRVRAA
jgi:hypothetical protein